MYILFQLLEFMVKLINDLLRGGVAVAPVASPPPVVRTWTYNGRIVCSDAGENDISACKQYATLQTLRNTQGQNA